MRLIYASRTYSTHDKKFVSAWRDEGLEVECIFVDGGGNLPATPSDGWGTFESRLQVLINEFQPDVIHGGPLTDVGWAVTNVWDGPFVAMSWGFDLMRDVRSGRVAREQAQAVISRAEVLILDNNGTRRVAIDMGADISRIVQFPWGIDLTAFSPGPSGFRDSLKLAADELVILCTRRHEPLYDVQTVVNAFVEVAPVYPRLRLVLAGAGSETAVLQAAVKNGGLEMRVNFLGEVDQILLPSVYRAADLYVSASHVDGSSVSLLEAMASGVPVCVSNIEGNAQWIADGRGLSFSTGDVGELAAHLRAFAGSSSEQFHRISSQRCEKALAYVKQHADWEKTRKKLPVIARTAINRNMGNE